ncbi:hypothetical protein KSS87_009749 [Heliosperma pusillum]|nr:hypothetical protein KSS87_009749 [Heliosperma pusillum]
MASSDQEIPEGTLKNILDQNTLKWVFVGGKGGVGKTTCSSILAILLASVRTSVLIISTDPAHNLSDAFQQRGKCEDLVALSLLFLDCVLSVFCFCIWIAVVCFCGMSDDWSAEFIVTEGRVHVDMESHTLLLAVNSGGLVRERVTNTGEKKGVWCRRGCVVAALSIRLYGGFTVVSGGRMGEDGSRRDTEEVDPSVENEDVTGDGQDNFVSELANAIPGIDEAMSFAEMLKLVQTMDYSVIVFDTAPTGHTLRLLQFPSTLEKGLTKLMSLKNKFGGLLSQMTRMFGVEDEFGEDAILGRLEGMKDVIEQVNQQFRDPDLTTFVCVCIPEFLSLYETERLVQELAKFEIDTHNIIINQVLFDDEVVDSKLLKARMRMQERYIDQFYMLYEDFNISKLPLMPEEVTGLQALKSFSRHFLIPYQPAIKRGTVEELEMRIAELNRQLKVAEDELDKVRKGKQKA